VGESNESSYVAFASFEAATGECWHVTLRQGMTQAMATKMIGLCVFVGKEAMAQGLTPISEYNEYRASMPITTLRARREAKIAQEEKAERARVAKAEARAVAAKKAEAKAALLAFNKAAAAEAAAENKQGKTQTRTPPTQARSGNGGSRPGFTDLTKSPIAISRLSIQEDKNGKTKVHLFSPNEKLKGPIWRIIPAIITNVIRGHYDVNAADVEAMLSVVGKSINVSWLVHWIPSPKNPKWKDILDIEIPAKVGVRNPQIQVGQPAPRPEAELETPESEIPF